MNWTFWLIFSLILAFGAGIGTLIWWRVGDQWADAEHKKFGPRRGAGSPDEPTVISGFGAADVSPPDDDPDHPHDAGPPRA